MVGFVGIDDSTEQIVDNNNKNTTVSRSPTNTKSNKSVHINDENHNTLNTVTQTNNKPASASKRRRQSVSILKHSTTTHNTDQSNNNKRRATTAGTSRLSTNKRVSFGVIHLREFDGHENQTVDLASRQVFHNSNDDSNEHIDTSAQQQTDVNSSNIDDSDEHITFNPDVTSNIQHDNVQYIPDPVYDDDTDNNTDILQRPSITTQSFIASPITTATPSTRINNIHSVAFISPTTNTSVSKTDATNSQGAELTLMELLKKWKNTQSPAVTKYQPITTVPVRHDSLDDSADMELTAELQGGIVSRRISTMPTNCISTTNTVDTIDLSARRATMDITQSYGGIVSTSDDTTTQIPTVQQEYTRIFGTSLQLNRADNTADMSLTRMYGHIIPSTPSIQSVTAYTDAAVAARLTQSANRYPKSPGSMMTAISLMSPPTVSGHHHIKAQNTDTQPITFTLPSPTPTPSNKIQQIIPNTTTTVPHNNNVLAVPVTTQPTQQPFSKSSKIARSPVQSVNASTTNNDDMDLTLNMGSILSRRISTMPAARQSIANNRRISAMNDMDLTSVIPSTVHTIDDSTIPVFTSPNSDKRRESRLSRRYSSIPSTDVTERLRERMQHILNGSAIDKTIDLPRRDHMSEQTKQVAELMERVLNGESNTTLLSTLLNNNQIDNNNVASQDRDVDGDEMELTSELQGGIISRRISTMPQHHTATQQYTHTRTVSVAEESEAELDNADVEAELQQLNESDNNIQATTTVNTVENTSQAQYNLPTATEVQLDHTPASTSNSLKFVDFLSITGISALDERSESYAQEQLRRRDSSIHQSDDHASAAREYAWPPTTLNELIELACCEGTESENIQSSCLYLLDACDDLKLNIEQLIQLVDNDNIPLLQQLQQVDRDRLSQIRTEVAQLRSYCKAQAKSTWYEWRINVSKQYKQSMDNHYIALNKDMTALDTLHTMLTTVQSNISLLINTEQSHQRTELLSCIKQLNTATTDHATAQNQCDGIDAMLAELQCEQLALENEVEQLKQSASTIVSTSAQLCALEEELCIQGTLLNQWNVVQHTASTIVMNWLNTVQLVLQLTGTGTLLCPPTLNTLQLDNAFVTVLINQMMQLPAIQTHLHHCTTQNQIPTLLQYLHIELSRCTDVMHEVSLLQRHHTVRTRVIDDTAMIDVTFTSMSAMIQCIATFNIDSTYPYTSIALTIDNVQLIQIQPLQSKLTPTTVLSALEQTVGIGQLTRLCQHINTIIAK